MTHTPPEQTATGFPPVATQPPVLTSTTSVASLPWAPRRRQARFEVRGLETHSPVFGRVVEASGGGLRLESAAPLVAGARYTFRAARGSRFLHLPGRVAWCRLDRFEASPRGSRAVFQAGVELTSGPAGRPWRETLAAAAGAATDV